MDVLADLLARAHARGAVFARPTLRPPWCVEFVDELPLSFHAVLEGELWVEADGEAPMRLLQGDLLLVRADGPYRLLHAPGAPAQPLGASPPEGDGPPTRLVCGAYAFKGTVCDSLLAALPVLVHLPGGHGDPAIRTALGLLTSEIGGTAPGQQTVLDRLLDLLLVYALRAWFARPDVEAPAWYRALDDPAVGAALRALHAEPARAWTVAVLADASGLSRAALARRFAALTGSPPLTYLTQWRMGLAREALLRPGVTLAGVALEVGYANEFAFAAAFKREVGIAPGRWRDERLGAVAA